ncbi:MAG: HesB/IscA family protein [Phycisphaerales bacterium]
MAVEVTDTAIREIAAIIRQQDLDPETIRLRVGVKGGGCSGFSYLLDLTQSEKDSDQVWAFTAEVPVPRPALAGVAAGGGDAVGEADDAEVETESFTVKVICDPKSYIYLNGTVVDFKEEIMGRGFVFNNPNATSSCGCGSSFSA